MKKIAYVLALLATIGIACEQKEALTREEVIAAIGAFDKAWKNNNEAGVDSILSPSYVYYTQSGGVFDRKNILHTAGSANYVLEYNERKQYDIKIEGNTAVANTIWYGKGSYFNNPFDDTQRCSITVIKQNGRVKILSEHCTLVK